MTRHFRCKRVIAHGAADRSRARRVRGGGDVVGQRLVGGVPAARDLAEEGEGLFAEGGEVGRGLDAAELGGDVDGIIVGGAFLVRDVGFVGLVGASFLLGRSFRLRGRRRQEIRRNRPILPRLPLLPTPSSTTNLPLRLPLPRPSTPPLPPQLQTPLIQRPQIHAPLANPPSQQPRLPQLRGIHMLHGGGFHNLRPRAIDPDGIVEDDASEAVIQMDGPVRLDGIFGAREGGKGLSVG